MRAIVRFETSNKTNPGLVEKDAGEVVKKVSNGLLVHTSNRFVRFTYNHIYTRMTGQSESFDNYVQPYKHILAMLLFRGI